MTVLFFFKRMFVTAASEQFNDRVLEGSGW